MFSVLRCLDERISDYMAPFRTLRGDHERLTGLTRRPPEAGQKFSHTCIMHFLCGMMCMQFVRMHMGWVVASHLQYTPPDCTLRESRRRP
jgi:hypothetical protein